MLGDYHKMTSIVGHLQLVAYKIDTYKRYFEKLIDSAKSFY